MQMQRQLTRKMQPWTHDNRVVQKSYLPCSSLPNDSRAQRHMNVRTSSRQPCLDPPHLNELALASVSERFDQVRDSYAFDVDSLGDGGLAPRHVVVAVVIAEAPEALPPRLAAQRAPAHEREGSEGGQRKSKTSGCKYKHAK